MPFLTIPIKQRVAYSLEAAVVATKDFWYDVEPRNA